jgi:hypothetical protein
LQFLVVVGMEWELRWRRKRRRRRNSRAGNDSLGVTKLAQ